MSRSSWRRWAWLAALLMLAAACSTAGGGAAEDAPASPPAESATTPPPAGSAAPGGQGTDQGEGGVEDAGRPTPEVLRFSAPKLGGGTVDGEDYSGRDVAIWFWAPW